MIRASVCALPVLGLTVSSFGVTVNVGPGESIQVAIDSASDGDTIVVAPGTYFEAIDFIGKAVTLKSSGGPTVTVIDASGLATSAILCVNDEGSNTVLDGFTITGGTGSDLTGRLVGGGMRNTSADTIVNNCIFLENSADEGGAVHNRLGHPTFSGCVFIGNTASSDGDGGGAMTNLLSDATILDCVFAANDGASRGGAILNVTSDPSITNCAFYQNTATMGGAIYTSQFSILSIINCTVAGNSATLGGAIISLETTLTVFNSILWNNSPDQIYELSGNPTVFSSNIMGGWTGPGGNNMSEPPVFVDPANGDYRLAPDSPCINQGDDSALPPNVNTDLDGNPRYVGPAVDLGPFESQEAGGGSCPWDFNGDGLIGITDFLFLIGNWGTPAADTDGDGDTGITDFLALIGNWGACP